MKKSIFEIILDSIAPDYCYFCSKLGSFVCGECASKNFSYGKIKINKSGIVSKEFFLDNREGILRQIVDEFKLQNKKRNARFLAKLLADSIICSNEFSNFEKFKIVPVPTSPKHIRQRGFDHIKILAKYLSKNLKIEVSNIIERNGNLTQRGADFKTRKSQAKKSYFLSGKVEKDSIYLVFDDIKTTGATLNSIAKILKQNGAKEVWFLYLLYQQK